VASVAPHVRSECFHEQWLGPFCEFLDRHNGRARRLGREHVLDPTMLKRASAQRFERALDVGCGEGRFCQMLRAKGIPVVGIDPTEELLATARRRDERGEYQIARAESLPFPDASFDLVVSYLTLIDIADFRTALKETVRVLTPKGALLIANLNSFIRAAQGDGSRISTAVTCTIRLIAISRSSLNG
jgi:ubiquinone/menaquinone biosynthesis C-methylase UbiE